MYTRISFVFHYILRVLEEYYCNGPVGQKVPFQASPTPEHQRMELA